MILTRQDLLDIKSEYDEIRFKNRQLLDERREEVYKKIPGAEELEVGSKLDYIDMIRERVLKGKAAEKKESGLAKSKELKRLLTENGYPENYLEPVFDCPLCKDTGDVDGVRCSCYNKKLTDRLYRQSNLGNVFRMESFDNFNLDYYSSQKWKDMELTPRENAERALRLAEDFVDSFDSEKIVKGMLIYGETGRGKSFLSNCIAGRLLERGHSVLYLSANELFNDVVGAYLIEKEEDAGALYELVQKTELLIIDDLGTEMTNSLVNSQLFEIINSRARAGKPVLISTNCSWESFSKRYQERIVSRIIADYTVLLMYGDDVRYIKRREQLNK
ncbi:MAG: ATP-binding protein [Lachnospiraceae bacterium]|nr:ATP-binding protein [Lachnospiraceae bacterium]